MTLNKMLNKQVIHIVIYIDIKCEKNYINITFFASPENGWTDRQTDMHRHMAKFQ